MLAWWISASRALREALKDDDLISWFWNMISDLARLFWRRKRVRERYGLKFGKEGEKERK